MANDRSEVARSADIALAAEEEFEPMSGDDLERIEATGAEDFEIIPLAQTAIYYRQQCMNLRDDAVDLAEALLAAGALEVAGFTHSADEAWTARAKHSDGERHG